MRRGNNPLELSPSQITKEKFSFTAVHWLAGQFYDCAGVLHFAIRGTSGAGEADATA
jgi:hypothetical protein